MVRDSSYRDKLIRMVMAKGYSLRKSQKIVDAVFDTMARAVRRGEIVEIPGGEIQTARNRPVLGKWQRMRNPKGEVFFRLTTRYKQRKRIIFRPDETIDLE
jgi:nucleoid DNA-binding protein